MVFAHLENDIGCDYFANPETWFLEKRKILSRGVQVSRKRGVGIHEDHSMS